MGFFTIIILIFLFVRGIYRILLFLISDSFFYSAKVWFVFFRFDAYKNNPRFDTGVFFTENSIVRGKIKFPIHFLCLNLSPLNLSSPLSIWNHPSWNLRDKKKFIISSISELNNLLLISVKSLAL